MHKENFKNKGRIMLKSTLSQHESVGFVIIVALVLIVGAIFLGIRMNQREGVRTYEDNQIMNFISASYKYTSECVINGEYLDLGEMQKRCYNSEKCMVNGHEKDICEELYEIYYDMMGKTWPVSGDSFYNYYNLSISYRSICTNKENVFVLNSFSEGDKTMCKKRRVGQDFIPYTLGTKDCIITELEICESVND